MTFSSILPNIVSTVIGGVVLSLLFFFAKEKLFSLPDIGGRWYFETRVSETAYRPYDGMVLRFVALLWREGHRIGGTVEKIFEDSSTGQREFIGDKRTRGVAEGYLEKNYMGADRLLLHVVEEGHGRESSSFYELRVSSRGQMVGTFSSMVADQTGTTIWQRGRF